MWLWSQGTARPPMPAPPSPMSAPATGTGGRLAEAWIQDQDFLFFPLYSRVDMKPCDLETGVNSRAEI